jgi:hypothetical protein
MRRYVSVMKSELLALLQEPRELVKAPSECTDFTYEGIESETLSSRGADQTDQTHTPDFLESETLSSELVGEVLPDDLAAWEERSRWAALLEEVAMGRRVWQWSGSAKICSGTVAENPARWCELAYQRLIGCWIRAQDSPAGLRDLDILLGSVRVVLEQGVERELTDLTYEGVESDGLISEQT